MNIKTIFNSIFRPHRFVLDVCKKSWNNGSRSFVPISLFGIQPNTYIVTDMNFAKEMLGGVYQPNKPSGCPFQRATKMSRDVLKILGTQSTLMTNDTNTHNEVRSLILKHFSEYRDSIFYKEIFNEVMGSLGIEREISTNDITLKYTASVILKIVFGNNISVDIERVSKCIEKVSDIGFLMNRLLFLKPFLNASYKKQENLMNKIMHDLISGADENSFAQKMKSLGYNEEHIFSELITLFAAGHETSSSVVSNAIFEMINHPNASPSQIKKEVLRYYTPTWILSRDYKIKSDEYSFPTGTYLIPVYALNRNSSSTPNAEVFDPFRKQGEYISFGHGKYSFCSGASIANIEIDVFLEEFNKIKDRFTISKLPRQKYSTVAKPIGGTIRPKSQLV